MKTTYNKATISDAEHIFSLCKQLIDKYENINSIDYEKVLLWVRRKLENSIDEYTTIYADGKKAGYYHFYKNEDGEYELDDLYIFEEFQSRGIGSAVIKKCCSLVDSPVMLYVFIKNERAIALYKRLGFEVTQSVGDSRYIMSNKHSFNKVQNNA